MSTVCTSFRVLVAIVITILVSFGQVATANAADTVDAINYQTLKYRSIGPFRGGRVTAIAGIEGDPLTY